MPEQTIPTRVERRRCDRAIWTGLGQIPDVQKDIPTIVIEFISAKRRDCLRDYEQKLREYLGVGVRVNWIIDRFRRIMTVYRNHSGPAAALGIKEAESYQTDLLSGFDLPLARLLAKADDRPKQRR